MTLRKMYTALPVALLALAALAGCSDDSSHEHAGHDAASSTVAAAVDPERQDAGHRRLNQLVGTWKGDKSTFVAGGTADNPVRREIVSHWEWIAETGNNFLREEAEDVHGSGAYYRLGLLGFGPTDNRYEWTTVDSVTPMTMSYKGAKGSGGDPEIVMAGEFTDPGVLGAQFAGKTIPMRTVIRLESADRVIMEIYFTPPGAAELVADRVVLTRQK
ncbi:DUF1579 family protein [Nocardia gamkensis]|uniref:DUF1579 domain-containing protein n=1 Tax=Nocardia gamkensis TaxID=352869 RepID=A0A7X6L8I4_9NOCA|nr:DUF1579 family protein [Nocardia gamkensis]NKY29838.1 DUF1579 domain-containing protein [Nocardia gamkensis]NQE70290.1 hypothetical protein [Nocardia gamkensis]